MFQSKDVKIDKISVPVSIVRSINMSTATGSCKVKFDIEFFQCLVQRLHEFQEGGCAGLINDWLM